MISLRTIAAVLLLAATTRAADAPPLLEWRPLAAAKPGATARYEGKIADSAGKVVDTYPLVVAVTAADEDEVRLSVTQRTTARERTLAPDADAGAILDALRLLPPGVSADSAKAAPAKAKVHGHEVDATRVTLGATLGAGAGAAHVKVEAIFTRDVTPLGLLGSRTVIDGGGAGISTLDLVEQR